MKKKIDLVTAIIPYYRKERYFPETLKSVLKQKYKNIEIIIVYDDENKSDLNKIKSLTKNNKKIKIFVNNKNIGAGASRNKAARYAKGKYLAFIDADDIWNKFKISAQIKFMKENKFDLSHTSYSIINEHGNLISKRIALKKLYYNDLLKSCDIGLSTVMIDRRKFLKYKFSKNKTKEDYSLWLKLSKKKFISGLNKNLTLWRDSPNSLSSNIPQKLFDAFDIYYNQEKFNFVDSLFKVINLSINFLKKSY